MRILIATSHRSVVGGVEKYLQSAIPGLMRYGHSIGLLHEYALDPEGERVDHQELHLPTWCAKDLGIGQALASIADWAPDLVYSHGLADGRLEDALLSRFPTVLYQHTYNGTCISGRKCHAWPDLRPCSRQLGAACLFLYFPLRCGGLHPGTMWTMFQQQTARRSRFPRYQRVLVASRHMRDEIERHGVPPARACLVPLPMTSNLPDTAPPHPKYPQGRILFLGRVVDVKGAGHLIRALPLAAKRLARPLSLTIAGEGDCLGQCRELASQLNVAVDFAGWLGAAEKISRLQRTDLLAVPSLWPEPFGLVGIEAGLFGVPAVSYAVGGIPDWLVPGVSGELAPGSPPTVEDLADAIVRALGDPDHYQQLSRGAWEMSRAFTLESHFARLEDIFADCAVPRSGALCVTPPVQ